jgi:hypothetical protein
MGINRHLTILKEIMSHILKLRKKNIGSTHKSSYIKAYKIIDY